MNIQRYHHHVDTGESEMFTDPGGEYVTYHDHAAIVQMLEDQIINLRREKAQLSVRNTSLSNELAMHNGGWK